MHTTHFKMHYMCTAWHTHLALGQKQGVRNIWGLQARGGTHMRPDAMASRKGLLIVGVRRGGHEVKASTGPAASLQRPHRPENIVSLQGQMLQARALILLQICLHTTNCQPLAICDLWPAACTDGRQRLAARLDRGCGACANKNADLADDAILSAACQVQMSVGRKRAGMPVMPIY